MVTLGRAGGGAVVPAQRASGTPPRPALPSQSPEWPPGEAGRPSLPWGHTCPPAVPTETGDRKGLFLEKGDSSLKTDMVVF